MKKRIAIVFIVGGLAVGLASLGLMAQLNLDEVLERYPGALHAAADGLDLDSLTEGALHRQSVYQTSDELWVVKRWYLERFGISPASDMNLNASDNCVWLTQSKLAFRLVHTVTVLLCSAASGTRIHVNESVYLVNADGVD